MVYLTQNTNGDVKFFVSITAAYAEHMRDNTVWKIAGNNTSANTINRWVTKRRNNLLHPDIEAHLSNISNEYKNEYKHSNCIYWIRELLFIPDNYQILKKITPCKTARNEQIACMQEIHSSAEFVAKFCNINELVVG